MESGGSAGQNLGPPQSPQGVPYTDPTNPNPQFPQPRVPRLTKEEINVLEECNTESFWYRCVPLGLALGGAATYLVKTGHLKPHPRYGAILKSLGAGFVGYVIGKLSYQSTCQQKILEKIPHTSLAQSVRKSKGITTFEDEPMTEASPQFPGTRRSQVQTNFNNMDSTSDIDTRNFSELDDNFRPSLDREVKSREEAASAISQRTLTYDELRQRNRQEYERNMATSSNSPFRQRPFSSRPSPPTPPDDASSSEQSSQSSRAIWDTPAPQSSGRVFDSGRGQKNQYGDVWDSN